MFWRSGGHDARTGGDATGEADHVHAFMGGECAADLAVAADHVEHTGGQVGLGHQLGELKAVVRGFLRWA